MKWHNMDTEPLESGVILYSERNNRIYDALYIGEGRFDINGLTVPMSNFDRWIQREVFFKEIGIKEPVETPCIIIDDRSNGHEYVDLGLPSGLLWATCNVGAKQPHGYGKYFQWGAIQGYYCVTTEAANHSTWNTCPWGFETPPITRLDLEHDAARANMGGAWRMPTREELQELYDNTVSEWTCLNGVNGMKFTSKSNSSNSIFIPAAGHYNSWSLYGETFYGYVWTSSLGPYDSSYAYGMVFRSSDVRPQNYYDRYNGFSVRGVLG